MTDDIYNQWQKRQLVIFICYLLPIFRHLLKSLAQKSSDSGFRIRYRCCWHPDRYPWYPCARCLSATTLINFHYNWVLVIVKEGFHLVVTSVSRHDINCKCVFCSQECIRQKNYTFHAYILSTHAEAYMNRQRHIPQWTKVVVEIIWEIYAYTNPQILYIVICLHYIVECHLYIMQPRTAASEQSMPYWWQFQEFMSNLYLIGRLYIALIAFI